MHHTLNSYIDHTILKPDATLENISTFCEEALHYQFAAVCIHPVWVSVAKDVLEGSTVKLCSVVGFPLGANTTELKAEEAKLVVKLGADEVDMVINIGMLKSGDLWYVGREIESVVRAAQDAVVKVIIETCLLTDDEKRVACMLCVDKGAHFVKTSTGFSKGGATVQDVALMRATVGPNFGIKASGGIRDQATALQMIAAGATRLGTSSGVAIMNS